MDIQMKHWHQPENGEDNEENREKLGTTVKKLDGILKNIEFWQFNVMSSAVARLADMLGSWAEGCPYHSECTCPYRGCRAPDLAAGDGHAKFESLLSEVSSAVVVALAALPEGGSLLTVGPLGLFSFVVLSIED